MLYCWPARHEVPGGGDGMTFVWPGASGGAVGAPSAPLELVGVGVGVAAGVGVGDEPPVRGVGVAVGVGAPDMPGAGDALVPGAGVLPAPEPTEGTGPPVAVPPPPHAVRPIAVIAATSTGTNKRFIPPPGVMKNVARS